MRGQVKPLRFLLFIHAQTEDCLGDKNDHDRCCNGPDAHNGQTAQLRHPIRMTEDCQHDDAEHAPHAMDRENIQRVIDLEPILHHTAHDLTDNACNGPDDQRFNGETEPEAGVIDASPAIVPVTIPTMEALP